MINSDGDAEDADGSGVKPNARQKRLQMADIARLAGVSTATVSRALNGSQLVNAETRMRVVDLARSLNYSINVGAQNLRLGHNRTVAVVVPYERANRQRVSDPFFLSLLGSLADALTDHGYDMLVSRIDAADLTVAAQHINTGRAVGVILIGQWHQHEQLNALASQKIPLVVWGAELPQQRYVTVGSDNVQGGFLATDALLRRDRRRLCFLGDTSLPEVAQRFAGYVRAHQEAGVRYDPALCIPTSFLAESGRAAVSGLIRHGAQIDGVFACSDLLAMSAISALLEAGISVPTDVAVIGYDDVELAAHFHPSISTVHQPIEEGGRSLVKALLELLETGASRSCTLPASLVERASTHFVS